jgi:hypothetical protein
MVSHEEVGNVRNRNRGFLSCRGEIYEIAPGGLSTIFSLLELLWPLASPELARLVQLTSDSNSRESQLPFQWLTRGVTGANTR